MFRARFRGVLHEKRIGSAAYFIREGDAIQNEEPLDEDEVSRALRAHPFVLCVSGLDIRKNHHLLYKVWRRLSEKYTDNAPHLVCVGEKGEGTEALLKDMRNDSRTRDRIHVIHNAEDPLLDWLYRNCLFTVYPSFYEGWGMPVAESLVYGKEPSGAKPHTCSPHPYPMWLMSAWTH